MVGSDPHLIIKPKSGWQLIDFKELAHYRDLFYFLVMRDIKVRYKQTVLGGLWAIIQPSFMTLVFSIFFGNLAKIPSDGVPYPIFSYSALIAWTYFSGAITTSSNSLVSESGLISKVYFPRIIVPLSPILSGLVDLAIAFIVLIGMMFYFRIIPTTGIIFLPLLILLLMLAASGTGMILATLNSKYRDIRYTVPFMVQFWMFASPIVYPVSVVPSQFHLLYAINPIAGVVEGFRSVLLGTTDFPTQMVLVSAAVSIGLFIIGALYFRQTERFFADVI